MKSITSPKEGKRPIQSQSTKSKIKGLKLKEDWTYYLQTKRRRKKENTWMFVELEPIKEKDFCQIESKWKLKILREKIKELQPKLTTEADMEFESLESRLIPKLGFSGFRVCNHDMWNRRAELWRRSG